MPNQADAPIQLHSHDLKNTRDLRTLLLEAAYASLERPAVTEVHVYLHHCTLAKKRVAMEFEQFKQIALSKIAKRIKLHDTRIPAESEMALAWDSSSARSDHARRPATASQEAVVAYLLERYRESLPGVSVSTIAEQTRASLPTIYKVLKTYAHCIDKDPEARTLQLRSFGSNDWQHWMQRSNQLSSVYFIDRSGAPRSASRLVKGLARLKREDIAVGGLMGALHHLPALDATASPQLDILVHGSRRADLSFITEIDPGLELHEGRPDMVHVAVHFIDRPASLFMRHGGQQWGSLPDCIANMQKAGLTYQVNDALRLLRTRN
jgi:hypothetical protein